MPEPTNPKAQQEPAQLSRQEINLFLHDVGLARHTLKELHGYLSLLKEGYYELKPDLVEARVQSYTAKVERALASWDRKPVFEKGVELRLQNEPLGLCAGKHSCRILLEDILHGRLDQAIKHVVVSERCLTEIYRTLSGRESTPRMIES